MLATIVQSVPFCLWLARKNKFHVEKGCTNTETVLFKSIYVAAAPRQLLISIPFANRYLEVGSLNGLIHLVTEVGAYILHIR